MWPSTEVAAIQVTIIWRYKYALRGGHHDTQPESSLRTSHVMNNKYKVLAINMLFMYVCMIIYLLCTYCVNVGMNVIVYIGE